MALQLNSLRSCNPNSLYLNSLVHHPQNTKDNNGVGLGRNLSIAGGCFCNMPDLKANNVSHCRNHRHLVKLALKLNSHLPVKAVILWGLNHNNKP